MRFDSIPEEEMTDELLFELISSVESVNQTYSQREIDFARIERELDTLEAEAKAKLVEILNRQKAATTDFLGKKVEKGELSMKLINDLSLKYQQPLQATIREFMRSAFDTGKQDAQREIGRYTFALKKIPPVAALDWFDKKSFLIKNIFNDTLLKKIKAILASAMETGETMRETMAKIEATYEPYVGDPQIIKDEKQVQPYRIETVIRNAGTSAYNGGRLAMFTDPDLEGYVVAVKYSAILDPRTTEICRSLHGKIVKLDDPDFQKIVPPNHHNCRSLLVPVTQDDDAFEPIRRSEMDEALRLMPEDFGGRLGND